MEKGVLLIYGAIIAVTLAVVAYIVEGAVWDAAGQTFEAVGRPDIALLWNLLGMILTLVAVVTFVSWLWSKVGERF